MQFEAPTKLQVPAAQSVQTSVPPGAYRPAMQSLQVFDLDPIVGEALPGAHAVHLDTPAEALQVPAAQSWHASVDAIEN